MQAQYDPQTQTWDIAWKHLSIRLQLVNGALFNTYFGPAEGLERAAPFQPDPLLETRSLAGVSLAPDYRLVRWRPGDWRQPSAVAFHLALEGDGVPLRAELRLIGDKETGLLQVCAELIHADWGDPVTLASATSASLIVADDVRELVHLTGRWGAETQVQRLAFPDTTVVLESRAGKTGFEYAPYAALLGPDRTYVVELLWSGNWEMRIRRLPGGRVSLSTGLNDWGLRHTLRRGDRLELPAVFVVGVKGDLNTATRRLHGYRRRFPLPDNQRPIPVQYNSWFAYSERVPVHQMQQAAAEAATLGCEVFVLDAGWYTTAAQASSAGWWMRTGDWIVDRRWFPNGLEELSSFCHTQGIDFGLWFEPEAVGPAAAIRREHPEWLHVVGGLPTPPDQRALLNLGVPEARAFIRDRILSLLRATKADWMKWDLNSDLRQGGWAPGTPGELARQDPIIAHCQGLYLLQAEIRAALPDLTLEMCAGGGGRFDPAILANSHVNWMSDQTQALMNLAIHFGSQLAHCAFECNDWLVEWPPHNPFGGSVDLRGDLPFRTRVAMLGSFGVGAPLQRWTDEDKAVVKTHITWYKQIIQPIILNGDQYFLTDPPPLDGQGDWAAVWYAARNGERGVLFAFRLAGSDPQRLLPLPGLIAEARYRLRTPEGWVTERPGAELADGLLVEIAEHFRSALITVEKLA